MIYLINPVKHRFYLLTVHQDIFGTWMLKRIYGSTINNRGRSISQIYDNENDAWNGLTDIEYKKRQRGYFYADTNHSPTSLKPSNSYSNNKPDIALPRKYTNQPELALI